ncbi:hypothetical protein BDW22DRAFT_1360779 [Trametopsis cervina]|nr:hypothetical protein BDW22DRAFT_1360779 [Trametopsis cervina]
MPPRRPPAKAPASQPSKSQALVTTGPKEIVVKRSHTKRDAEGHKPTTARALVLRNGKYGAMGTGEVSLSTKISGREKLELIAEDLVENYGQALATPFNAEKAIKIAEAQYTACLDEIQNLQDPFLFHHAIKSEAEARKPNIPAYSGKRKTQRKDPLADPAFIASVISSKIHNTYMFASAWRLVGLTLTENVDTENDGQIRNLLKKDPQFRARYLVLYDLVNILVGFAQQKFAQLATTAPHWGQYFHENQNKEEGSTQPEYIFSWEHLKSVHKSFLDSIVVELCLPESPYPKQILIHILHEAIDETPRDAKRFPQELWDAMGDFSSTVQLLELLETPLLGPDGNAWKKEPRAAPEEYENWVDAQIFSEQASLQYQTFQDMLIPIDTELRKPHIVQTIWKFVNLNYQAVSGQTIDNLWGLDDIKYRKPSWHAKRLLGGNAGNGDYDSDSDSDAPPKTATNGKKKSSRGAKKPPLVIPSSGYDSHASMPSLMTVTETSGEESEDDDDDDDENDDESDESDDEDEMYDEDEEDHLREMIREAMDMAQADPDFNFPRREAAFFKEAAEDKKGNSFIKLLGSLRGRMFNGNPNLKTSSRKEPRQPYTGPKPPASAYTPAQPKPNVKPATKAASTAQQAPQTKQATVEEVSDEDEPSTNKKKKKKKPKKKKKKSTATADGQGTEGPAEGEPAAEAETEEIADKVPERPVTPPIPPTPTSAQQQRKPSAPTSPKSPRKRTPSVRSVASSMSSTSTVPAYASTTSLTLPTEQTAQSARSYLQKTGLASEKAKVKTRSDQPTIFTVPEKPSLFSRMTGKKDKEKKADSKDGDKYSFLSKMTRKTKTYMHQLLHSAEDEKQGIAPMKWENFLKVMREMGFTYDPSTAGSSVRFDPPDARDPSITFHKPHPDPTLQPYKVREFGRRLTRAYGWSAADFYTRAQQAS